jgi:hypothetical protein
MRGGLLFAADRVDPALQRSSRPGSPPDADR